MIYGKECVGGERQFDRMELLASLFETTCVKHEGEKKMTICSLECLHTLVQ